MPKKSQIISLIVVLSAALICLFINRAITYGLLLGWFFSRIHLQLLISSFRDIAKNPKSKPNIADNFLRLAVLALPLAIAVLLRDRISIVATVVGITMNKICLIMDEIKKIRRDKNGNTTGTH